MVFEIKTRKKEWSKSSLERCLTCTSNVKEGQTCAEYDCVFVRTFGVHSVFAMTHLYFQIAPSQAEPHPLMLLLLLLIYLLMNTYIDLRVDYCQLVKWTNVYFTGRYLQSIKNTQCNNSHSRCKHAGVSINYKLLTRKQCNNSLWC